MSQMPPPAQPSGEMMRPHRGVMILVFGILGLLICLIFGIVAWVMGNADLNEMAAGRMDPTGEGMTKAGKILGMISVILTVIGIGVWVVILIVAAGAVAAGAAGGGP